MRIYFTDWFQVDSGLLEEYGAFNISLINDLPLFIDPFLLFASEKQEYRDQHDKMIAYLKFLRDQAVSEHVDDGLLRAWYMFPEVKQLWLGYSLRGNQGSGLGWDFARALHRNLHVVFTDFGNEKVTAGSHLEKVCLVQEGVGRDNISDFTANLIKEYLLRYTERFAQAHIRQDLRKRVRVPNVIFNYDLRVWTPREFDLPFISGDYVILTPKDLLTKDENWINRSDMVEDVERIVRAVPDEQLRAQINQYLLRVLKPDATERQRRRVHAELYRMHPQLIEWYIRSKENRRDEAVRASDRKVMESERVYVRQIRELVEQLQRETAFYERGVDTLQEAKARVQFLKQEVENNGAYRLFYDQGKPIQRESDLHILYRLTWFASPSDLSSEVNDGRGPVDFKVSRGSKDKALVEFKLAKSSKLKQGLAKQVPIYEKASRTSKSLKVIFFFTAEEKKHVDDILAELKLTDDDSIVLVDARDDNKPSASKA